MKRREFLSLTLGGAAAALTPLPRLAAAAPAVIPVSSPKYVWAVAMARAQNNVSAEMLQSSLKIGATEASGLMTRLAARGVINVPNAAGVARAAAPVFRGSGYVPVAPPTAALKTPSDHPGIKKLAEHVLDDDRRGPNQEAAVTTSEDQPASSPLPDSQKP
ncbi:MAG: hypothetical protein ACRBB0_03195 [Pelagimonas sp.]|uniref:hypothetical protein n=1 Tax=Pelagimonas sp. TaxID=2073170 RepID=UPI003D6B8692